LKVLLGETHDPSDLAEEPRVDAGPLMEKLGRRAAAERGEEPPEPVVGRRTSEVTIGEVDRVVHLYPGRRFPEQPLAL